MTHVTGSRRSCALHMILCSCLASGGSCGCNCFHRNPAGSFCPVEVDMGRIFFIFAAVTPKHGVRLNVMEIPVKLPLRGFGRQLEKNPFPTSIVSAMLQESHLLQKWKMS